MAAIRYRSDLSSTADLVIVGGGIVGAATAFHAARAGFHPLILERRPRLCTLTTPVATGAFRLQFDNREEMDLVRESVELFLNFEEMTGEREYRADVRQQGYLFVTTTEEGAARQRELVARQHGWGQTDIELLDGEETRYRFPQIGSNVWQARFRAGDGFLDQKQVAMGLVSASGTEVLTGCEVTGFEVQGGRLRGVRTTQGTFSTDRAVIAAGPFSGVVAALADVSLPVETVVRHKVILPHIPAVPPNSPMVIDEETAAHWRPALQGAYLLFTDPETPPSPPMEDVPSDHRFAFRVLDPESPVSVARVTPFWEEVWARGAANWLIQSGQYTMTPDHRPLIDQTAVKGLYVNSGYSGHGIMGGPAGSRVLIDVVTGRLSPAANPFRLTRSFTRRSHSIL